MRFEDWEPLYLEIIRDMGYDRVKDEESARVLSGIISGMPSSRKTSILRLEALVRDRDVLVCGNAPTLEAELEEVQPEDFCVIAADGAAAVLMDKGIVPHIIVTDLDGDVEAEIKASQAGAVMVVHGHGDNIPVIRSIVPGLCNVLGSTQAVPLANVHNFGGFTDGDRCVFLARELGASAIVLIGFDFSDPHVNATKRKKLEWARKLIDIVLECKAGAVGEGIGAAGAAGDRGLKSQPI
ncbi:MAG TPA: DUF115 domain-containing protein [Methanosarcinales archaeon]|nr:DUF115 domain-containing protein [Methanosarcinales archaeon]